MEFQQTVAAADLPATATQLGLQGRVITAVSYDGTNATFFSYAWSGDASAVYESRVIFTTLDGATQAFEDLANAGYLLTATGSTQATDGSGLVLVGTRVQGDTMARPWLVVTPYYQVDTLMQQGYATVGSVWEYDAKYNLILQNFFGER